MTDTRRGSTKWEFDLEKDGSVKLEWAEKFLIGTLLVHFDKHVAEIGEFEESRLHSEIHRSIFKAMMEIRSESRPVDVITVADRLQITGQIETFDSPINYLLDLLDNSEGWAEDHVAEWCRIVWAKSAIKQFKRDLKELERLADIDADTDGLRMRLAKLADNFPKERRRTEITLQEAVSEYAKGLELGQTETVRWGIPDVDDACGGFAPGEMVIIGARPSHGKSLIAMQWLDIAAGHGVPSLMISEEMAASSLAKRALQIIMPYRNSEWATDIRRLNFEINSHYEGRAPIVIAESCGKIGAVEHAVENAVRKHGIKIVVLDYAQLIKGDGGNRYEQVSDVSTRSKRLATKYQLVFLLIAQLSRKIESREDGSPQLADLKDSGQLEQDADVILFPQWPARSDPAYKEPNEYRIYQSKNRNRGIGTAIIQMRIDPERQWLSPWGCSEGF